MTLEEMIDKSIMSFFEGEGNDELDKIKPSKYNKKYFDDIDEEMFPADVTKKKVR